MYLRLKIIIFSSSLLFCSHICLMNLLPRFHLLLFHSLIPFFSHSLLPSPFIPFPHSNLISRLPLSFYSPPSFIFSHSSLTPLSIPHSFPFLVSDSSLFLPFTLIQTFPSSYPPSHPFSLLPPASYLLSISSLLILLLIPSPSSLLPHTSYLPHSPLSPLRSLLPSPLYLSQPYLADILTLF